MKAVWLDVSRKLTLEQTWDAAVACPICDDAVPRRPVLAVQDEPPIVMLECPRCRGVSASRMPTDAYLASYYRSFYADAHLGQGVTFADPARLACHIVSLLPDSWLERRLPLRLCDFGGGDGSLALAVARLLPSPPEITVVDLAEPETHPPELARAVWRRELADVAGPFDLVIASAVLEHIPRLGVRLRELAGLLAQGAALYARTPYWLPLSRLAGVDLGFPAHVHDLGAPFWHRVGPALGLPLRLQVSRASIVETTFAGAGWRTLAAYLLKAPSRLESLWRSVGRDPLWRLVGGWEVLLRAPD